MAQERSMKLSRMLKRFLPYFGKYKHLLILDLLAAALTTVCELVLPLIVRNITNSAASTDPAMALAFVKALGDPQKYAEELAALDKRTKRVQQRQKEAKAHEKNVRFGKK